MIHGVVIFFYSSGDAETMSEERFEDYDQALDYLYDLQFFGVKFGLENTRELLRRLGDPHLKYRTIHVTGTNGKGSVCAFLESMLRTAGYKVGLYTSPHLIDFTERIVVDGKEISREDVTRLSGTVKAHVVEMAKMADNKQCTFFEATTALAFKYFEEQKVDVAVIEVGMGGRLDSTNHLDPEACVITSIGVEHTQYLGDTEAKIAYEKAGIIKPEVPVVVGNVSAEAMDVIAKKTEECRSNMVRMGKDFGYTPSKEDARSFTYWGFGGLSGKYQVGVHGEFQKANASLALAAIEAAMSRDNPLTVDIKAARTGLASAKWPGRLHAVRQKPLIVLDGAHNPHGMKALAETVPRTFQYDELALVIGMMADKDQGKSLEAISGIADTVIATQARIGRSLPADKLAALVKGKHAKTATNIADAIAEALKHARKKDLILITGSLYVVGEALAILEQRRPEPNEIVKRLRALYSVGAFPGRDVGGNEDVEIASRDPFQVLISTILSQRTRDENTHRASMALFEVYDTAEKLAKAPIADVERLVRPSGFFKMKARYVKAAASKIVEDFEGKVPREMEELLTIPAVGRKTANCVLVYGFGIPAIPVDVHVHRISNRLGLVGTDDPEETELALQKVVPRRLWTEINRLMVRHGQQTCLPRNPKCPACDLRDICRHSIASTIGSAKPDGEKPATKISKARRR